MIKKRGMKLLLSLLVLSGSLLLPCSGGAHDWDTNDFLEEHRKTMEMFEKQRQGSRMTDNKSDWGGG